MYRPNVNARSLWLVEKRQLNDNYRGTKTFYDEITATEYSNTLKLVNRRTRVVQFKRCAPRKRKPKAKARSKKK